MLHVADQLAFDRAMVTQPVWNRFNTAADALDLADNVLLHAGPAFASPDLITVPILNSACVAAVWQGLARDFDQAEAMILKGEIELKPAQDHDVVTPLAAVVSADMPLHTIYDAWRGQQRVFTPINAGSRPAMRLGLRSEAVLDHIRWLNTRFLDVLDKGLAEGIALVPLAVTGLMGGDDCHGRTPVATNALIAELKDRTIGGIDDEDALAFMASSPSLFLNLWMAATKCMMKLAEGVESASFVTAAGGNGRDVGIQISGLPGQWFTIAADPPKGKFVVDLPQDRALGAIGDSAVVEAFALGAMAIELSPEQKKGLGAFLPDNARTRSTGLSVGTHPYFRTLDIRLGTTARGAVAEGSGPVIGLGILDKLGEAGRLGGGIYDMPVTPFSAAMDALER
ncbi:DUF1116 domain-containing protein [Rhodobacteraceae bacterium B1Z28]|uniref:DUF1116 domain-containing protein n=1 Tax=Ruegeria haliotis TaxID=2747601 RepID=A0ABX2PY28_9RHOB|nr:DUF1116 domain-containing protein [Ruegeria haliotis]NVO58447.1 DUF1116 domain-containing protein [Ruegeria haliotis]